MVGCREIGVNALTGTHKSGHEQRPQVHRGITLRIYMSPNQI